MAYADTTRVSVAKTRTDIEDLLKKYGATEFAYASKASQAMLMFNMEGRQIKFLVNMPT